MICRTETLAEYLGKYRGCCLRLADTTLEQLRVAVRLFDRHVGRPVLVAELTEQILVEFLQAYCEHVSPATVNSKRRALLCIWAQAAKDGLVPPPSRDRIPKAKELRRLPDSWSIAEISRLVQVAGSMRGTVGRVPRGLWWSSLIRALWETSCRVSAMLSVRPLDCHLDESYLLVRAEATKSLIDQVFWLSPDGVEAVARVYDRRASHVWPWPYTQRHFFKTLRQIVEAAGLPSDKTRGGQLSHKLRRSNLSHVAAVGGIQLAQQQAGHSTPATTLRFYVDPRVARQPSAVDVLPRLFVEDEQLRLF